MPKTVTVALTLFALFVSGCDRHRRDIRALEKALETPTDESARKVGGICQRLGAEGVDRVRLALTQAEEWKAQIALGRALLICNVNGNIAFIIDELGDDFGQLYLHHMVEGLLDRESQRILRDLARSSSGPRFTAAVTLLQTICDDRDSLRFAESLLTGRDLPPDELHPVITLISQAAGYSLDSSPVEALRGFLNHEVLRIRMAALIALTIVPGEDAERLMLETARNSPDNYTDEFVVDLIRARKGAFEAGKLSAPGWRSE